MCSDDPPPQHITNEYGESLRESLTAQIDLAPFLYEAEADPDFGRKAYARLNQDIIAEGLYKGENNSAGIIGGYQKTQFSDGGDPRRAGFDAYGNFLGSSQFEQDIGERAKENQTRAEIRLADQYGSQMTDAYRDQGNIRGALNDFNALGENQKYVDQSLGDMQRLSQRGQGYDDAVSNYQQLGGDASDHGGLRSQMLGQARDDLSLGGDLSDRERRNVEQMSREAMTARGRSRDFMGVVDEVQANESARREREGQRREFASQQMGLADQALVQDRQFSSDRVAQEGNQLAADRGYAAQRFNAETTNLGNQQAYNAQRLGLEQATSADPFMAITGRSSVGSVATGQNLYGNASKGIDAGAQLYNPHTGAQFIAQQTANQNNFNASNYAAQQQKKAGMFGGAMGAIGTIGGALLGG